MTMAYRFDDSFRNMAAAKSAYAARQIGRAKAACGGVARWNARPFLSLRADELSAN